jgi:hypothetical protein
LVRCHDILAVTVGIVLEQPTGVCLDCGADVDFRAVLAGDEEKGRWATAEDGTFLLCIPSPGACDACGSGNVALRMTREERRAYEDLTRALLRRGRAVPRSPRARDVARTWRGPVRYLPMPLPDDWVLRGYDRPGMLRVVVGGAIELYICALESKGGRLLVVQVRRAAVDRAVTEAEAGGVLEQLRNVGDRFGEVRGQDIVLEGARVFVSRLGEPGRG